MLSQSQISGDKPEKQRNNSACNPNEKRYIRLYNLRNQKEKSFLLKSHEIHTAKNGTTKIKKKPLEERDKYLTNLYKEGLVFLEKVESDRSKTLKDEKNQMKLNTNFAWAENNKFFLEKVMQNFRRVLKSFIIENKPENNNKKDNNNNNNNIQINSDINNIIMYEIDEQNKIREEEKFEEKTDFDKTELKKFLFKFGFLNTDFSQENDLKSHSNDNNSNKISVACIKDNTASCQIGSTSNNINDITNTDYEKFSENHSGKENLRSSANTNSYFKQPNDDMIINNIKSNLTLASKKTTTFLKKTEKEKVNLQLQEKHLLNLFVENVYPQTDPESRLRSNDLFLYLVGILNLYDYFVYSSYKKTNPLTNKNKDLQTQSKIKNRKLPKTEEETSLKSQIICAIKNEIKHKALKKLRYSSLDSENKMLITEENANNLKKDFHMFYLNFMLNHDMKSNSFQILKAGVESVFKQNATFKPKIDENSRKLYSEYKRKVNVNDLNRSVKGHPVDLTKEEEHMEFIDNLILGKKKKQK